MKLVSVLIAIVVSVTLYFVVFERDTMLSFAGRTPQAEVPAPLAARTNDTPSGVRVVAMKSTAQTVDSAVVLRGRTQAARNVTVATETLGRVIFEPLRKGTFVAAGDTLCRLDPGTRDSQLAEAQARLSEAQSRVPEAQASLAEAEARIREADINVNVARQLNEGGFASQTRLVRAEAQSEAASAGIQRAKSAITGAKASIEAATAAVAVVTRDIDRLTITAPFAGMLETDTAELGTLLQPGSPCATIVQIDLIKLVGFVPELDVDRVALGAQVQAQLASGGTAHGQVSFVPRVADQTTRTFRVEVTVPNPDLAIRDGQTAEIVVASDGATAHLVPQSALTLNDDGDLGVRLVSDDGTAQFAPVTMLRDTADGVWLTGLPDAVNIITVGQDFVSDGVDVLPAYAQVQP
jgi:multidrug efflux system membrane fusion protein